MASIPQEEEDDLSPEDTQTLLDDNFIQPSSSAGKRKVSRALLSRPSIYTSTSGSISSSSTSSVSVRTHGFGPGPQFGAFEMPTASHSAAGLEFIGFDAETAAILFQRYLNRPDPDINTDTLMAYVKAHVGILDTPSYQDLQSDQALQRIGINQKLRDAILDPEFKHLLGTDSLTYWVLDSLTTNFATLQQLQIRLKNHAVRSRGKK
ncbi:hypothetical protein LTR20_009253 [Exophiala xenobiotica]|nr:hypothetical protein LTS13_011035 [Exophiala xenobiotica]KAK5394011.1 hypothetical protein LTR79_008955 [Exophiala xenobiotica]KAK5408279.1 hypothetical protein LTR90_009735 [Exophiala xenobiotica]KAK5456312.1 hypothetical protein LTR20_009253 [Exophiala xenobiotica]KAK5470169.1 hypothetical protein LTR26_011070 [Exophiala xenobiotica]